MTTGKLILKKRRTISAISVLLLAALLPACSFFGNDSGNPMEGLREQIRLTVTDADRADAMLVVVGKLDDKLVEMADILASAVRAERELFRDYESTREDYESFFRQATLERERQQRALLEIHVEFKSYLNEDEWGVILPVQTRAIATRVNTLVHDAFAAR
jgi:hypothetical protein